MSGFESPMLDSGLGSPTGWQRLTFLLEAELRLAFGVGVSEEFLRLHQAGVFSAAELDMIRQWGLQD
jgi:hypothetical protein